MNDKGKQCPCGKAGLDAQSRKSIAIGQAYLAVENGLNLLTLRGRLRCAGIPLGMTERLAHWALLHGEILALMGEIQKHMTEDRLNDETPCWGAVGDLVRYRDELLEITDSMYQLGEYAEEADE